MAASLPAFAAPSATAEPAACPVGGAGPAPSARVRATLDVLTYNIEGLGFPARRGRKADLEAIAARLQRLRDQGRAPDVVLFQEVFRGAARRAVTRSGYPNVVIGPGRRARRTLPADREARQGAGGRSIRRGEIGLKLTGGGLAIATHLPVEVHRAEPFSRGSCAGLDCFSNKGALFVRVRIDGAPEPVDIFNTHMNSRRSSRAPQRRTLPIHNAQVSELAGFIDDAHRDENPVILGGDFNMRNSEARFDFLASRLPLKLARQACQDPASGCDIRVSFDGDAPWMDTQDLQFFRSGRKVQVRPIRLEAMFDGAADSPRLSDHDGYRVLYELSWPICAGAGR